MLTMFAAPVRAWFEDAFGTPTRVQREGWPAIARGESTLLLAPTGSGKTLAAFLWALDRVMFAPVPPPRERCRVLYVSPLKALAVDVERNLRGPLAGIARAARHAGVGVVEPGVHIRTGDTPQSERARFVRAPADILITTPESLYLLLTSNARDRLTTIETVIVDEIHALVPTKRGAHLAVSLERLEERARKPIQRIGLSATQRPLDEVARYLGGARGAVPPAPRRRSSRATTRPGAARRAPAGRARRGPSAGAAERHVHDEFAGGDGAGPAFRPVTIVDAGEPKALRLRIEVPVEDMSRPGESIAAASGPAPATPGASIWTAIHPRLVELVRAHRSTLIFANSRRLAERLAAAINEIAGATIARSHHGSLAREQRADIEDQLKRGELPALVATSSLELGIDMGAVDLVVQVEAPPSVASGLQRIGRAGHQVGAASEGVVFPKFRGDLLACAAVARSMHDGQVEATRYPRNPLDVLAQQIVAAVSMDDWDVDALFAAVRRAATFHTLGRDAFEGVLDMLSGRYPSDEFAELRPRLTWDRSRNRLTARAGAKRLAIANAGTIPDRGLYGVFLAGGGRRGVRVGELDEEMVFETSVGEVFVLGASSWRVEEITHDRVLVSPAPGQPGKTPFWKGDRPGRPLELGLRVGELTRDLARLPAPAAIARLTTKHDLQPDAAENLVRYVREQAAAGAVPDAGTVVIERVRDDLGDWRVCLLSPRGSRVHAPWCMAVVAKIRAETGVDVETLWSDDGFVVRFPDVDRPPDPALFVIDPDEVESRVIGQVGATALFAARFRENAGRSLLLPKRRAGQRAPLWQQRKKSTDLLAVASRFGSFPVLLETYRECLRDVFDLPALVETLRGLRARTIRLEVVDPPAPTPFAASLLFGYVANFLYDGDAPLAERRAQALAVDQAQLRELIGDAELRDLFDAAEIAAVEAELQRVDPDRHARSADGIHDLLLEIGDLRRDEVLARTTPEAGDAALDALVGARRVVEMRVAGETRLVAVEDAARYRDALAAPMPRGVPEALRAPADDALTDLVSRYARTHAPFLAGDVARRLGLRDADVRAPLASLLSTGRVVQGEFTPGRTAREWCGTGVLRRLRHRSLARLRREVEAVDEATLGRFVTAWHGIGASRRGPDALLDVVEQLQGAPLVASLLEAELLPARLAGYTPEWLDTLAAAGEVAWAGLESLGHRDGRIALFLTDRIADLMPPPPDEDLDTAERAMLKLLADRGASFFADLVRASGDGYPGDVVDVLWRLVWKRRVTNDAFHALRARVQPRGRHRRGASRALFRSRRSVPPVAEGRWTLAQPPGPESTPAQRMTALARQLLARHGVLTREAVAAEGVAGGFSAVYPALRAMDDAGQVRRGYFVEGLGATQFALPGAVDLLRGLRHGHDEAPEAVVLAATDPANPYGASLRWPVSGPMRVAGAWVILVGGAFAAYVPRGGRELTVALPDEEPARSQVAQAVALALAARATSDDAGLARGLVVERVNGTPTPEHALASALVAAGFVRAGSGFRAAARPAGPG